MRIPNLLGAFVLLTALSGCSEDKIPDNSCTNSCSTNFGGFFSTPYTCPEANFCFSDIEGCAESGECPPI